MKIKPEDVLYIEIEIDEYELRDLLNGKDISGRSSVVDEEDVLVRISYKKQGQ